MLEEDIMWIWIMYSLGSQVQENADFISRIFCGYYILTTLRDTERL